MEKLRLIKVVWLLLGNNTEFSDENSELCNGEIIHLWLCREWIWRMHSPFMLLCDDKIEWVDYTHSVKVDSKPNEWVFRLRWHLLYPMRINYIQNQIVIWKTGIYSNAKLYFILKQRFSPKFCDSYQNTCLQDNLLL
jgi:hypothetical protein